MRANTKADAPPTYSESQNYPQFDALDNPVSNLGPPLSQTGSIFTYNTPTTEHQQVYSSEPAGPAAQTGIPPRQPGATPPEYTQTSNQYGGQTNQYGNKYGNRYGAQFGNMGAQFGSQSAGYSNIGQPQMCPTAPIVAGYQTEVPYPGQQGTAAIYNPAQGTVQTINLPAGYSTTPLAYSHGSFQNTGRKHGKIAIIIVCILVFLMVIVAIVFGVFA